MRSIFRRNLAVMAAAVTLAGSLSCNDPEETCENCDASSKLVADAKKDIGAGNFTQAIAKCNQAAEKTPAETDPRYCLVIAHLGQMVDGVNTLLAFAGGMLPRLPADPYYAPALDAKQFVEGYIAGIEYDMRQVDAQLIHLTPNENVRFDIPKFPVHLKFDKLARWFNDYSLRYSGVDYRLPGEVFVNAGGAWDTTELLLLGSTFNLILGALDYVMAHDMRIRRIPAESLQAFLAELLIDNPRFLSYAEDELADERIAGGDTLKGLRYEILAFLSFLAGRAETLDEVVPKNVGLREAIRLEAADPATNAVLKWYDDDGDGNPEAFESPMLTDFIEQLLDEKIIRIPLFVSTDTFDALYAAVDLALDNIENEGAAVPLVDLLDNLRLDVGDLLMFDSLIDKPVPDLVALDLGAFLADPPPMRKLTPYYFKYKDPMYATAEYWLLFEWEMYNCYDSYYYSEPCRYSYSFETNRMIYTPESAGIKHFDAVDYTALIDVEQVPDLTLADDGVSPNSTVRAIPYLALQSPSFGGLLHLNVAALGGTATMGEATNATFNEAVGRILKYYCVGLSFDGYSGIGGYFDTMAKCPIGSELQ